MKKSSARRRIIKVLLKAIFVLLTSSVYFLIIKNESKNLLDIKIGAKRNVFDIKVNILYLKN